MRIQGLLNIADVGACGAPTASSVSMAPTYIATFSPAAVNFVRHAHCTRTRLGGLECPVPRDLPIDTAGAYSPDTLTVRRSVHSGCIDLFERLPEPNGVRSRRCVVAGSSLSARSPVLRAQHIEMAMRARHPRSSPPAIAWRPAATRTSRALSRKLPLLPCHPDAIADAARTPGDWVHTDPTDTERDGNPPGRQVAQAFSTHWNPNATTSPLLHPVTRDRSHGDRYAVRVSAIGSRSDRAHGCTGVASHVLEAS